MVPINWIIFACPATGVGANTMLSTIDYKFEDAYVIEQKSDTTGGIDSYNADRDDKGTHAE